MEYTFIRGKYMHLSEIRSRISKYPAGKISGRKWCLFTIFVTFGILGLAALLVYVVDPHYRYRTPSWYDMVYYELYATAPRVLNDREYDLLMLGTSMTRNFFIEDIEKAFGGRAVKLAASGGTTEDLCKFFDVAKAARGDKLKRVVLSLDIYPLNKKDAHWKEFDFMYRKDHKEDYRYIFSRQTFSGMLYLIKRKRSPKKQRKHQADPNRMFSTEYAGKPYGFYEVLKDAASNEYFRHTQTPYDEKVHKKNFYGKLLPVIDKNPQIAFTVYLPPYHIYTYCLSEVFGDADALIKQRSEVMRELLKRKNVQLHDFQTDVKYVENHDYFCDVQHFSNIAAKEILKDILSGRRKISTEADVAANEKELRSVLAKNMPEYKKNMKKVKGE